MCWTMDGVAMQFFNHLLRLFVTNIICIIVYFLVRLELYRPVSLSPFSKAYNKRSKVDLQVECFVLKVRLKGYNQRFITRDDL